MNKCEVCNAEVTELRRGRCWGCYNRWVDERPVGHGARCILCGEKRRDRLKSVELLGGWWPTCYNCAGQAAKLSPMPRSMAEIRHALRRDRREGERREGKPDGRVFQHDRRSGERRRGRDTRASYDGLDDIALFEILDGVLEAVRQAEADARDGRVPRGKPAREHARTSEGGEHTQIRRLANR